MQQLYDVKGAAKLLALSPWTVRAFIRDGKMNPVRYGRLVRLDASEIERFIAAAKTDNRVARKSDEGGFSR